MEGAQRFTAARARIHPVIDPFRLNREVGAQAGTHAATQSVQSGCAHTLPLRGKDGSTGVALLESYDLDPAAASQLANLITRGFVQVDPHVLISGFVPGDSTQVVIRAIGPSLAGFGVPMVFPTRS